MLVGFKSSKAIRVQLLGTSFSAIAWVFYADSLVATHPTVLGFYSRIAFSGGAWVFMGFFFFSRFFSVATASPKKQVYPQS